MMIACPVCDSSPEKVLDQAPIATKKCDCPKCGTYSISDDFFAYLPSNEQHWNRVKAKLSLALRWASDRGTPVTLRTPEDIMSAIAEYEGAEQERE